MFTASNGSSTFKDVASGLRKENLRSHNYHLSLCQGGFRCDTDTLALLAQAQVTERIHPNDGMTFRIHIGHLGAA